MLPKSVIELDDIKRKMATVRVLLTGLSTARATQAAKLKTGELNSENSAKDQEILLTEMILYDTCANVIKALETSLL